jgi:hypothetical protein
MTVKLLTPTITSPRSEKLLEAVVVYDRLSPLMLWVWNLLMARCTTLCDKCCQWLVAGWWFSLGTPVSSTYKTDHHDISEILLKVVLNTINQTKPPKSEKLLTKWGFAHRHLQDRIKKIQLVQLMFWPTLRYLVVKEEMSVYYRPMIILPKLSYQVSIFFFYRFVFYLHPRRLSNEYPPWLKQILF